jgi:glycosyltransferase involved in cell wall biosynthesis
LLAVVSLRAVTPGLYGKAPATDSYLEVVSQMRIAQVAPLFESVPPRLYGGTERVVSALTEELVSRGHDVTLFASGDSVTTSALTPCSKRSLRLDGTVRDHVALTTIELATVFDQQDEFDVIHNHVDYFAFPFARQSRTPMITTTHGRVDLPEIRNVYEYFAEAPLVSISDAQREPLPGGNWLATVYNGIDFSLFNLHPDRGKYLAFLGRISPEKRPDRAIEIARALDMPLKIAAKVDAVDKDYFEHVVRPHLSNPLIEFVGEVGDRDKDEFLGNAFAYLFPIDWPEPFGLTMVEAMACGTPVVATNCGSVPEIIDDGVSGFICKSLRDMIDKVGSAQLLDRTQCRAYAEARFSAAVMADGYEEVYRQALVQGSRHVRIDNGQESRQLVNHGADPR